jgi:hypothetical protein
MTAILFGTVMALTITTAGRWIFRLSQQMPSLRGSAIADFREGEMVEGRRELMEAEHCGARL